jgi:hypothetical protein
LGRVSKDGPQGTLPFSSAIIYCRSDNQGEQP